MHPGRATAEGTARFRGRFEGARLAGGSFRQVGELWLSSIGLGTYLGEADDETDAAYEGAVIEALEAGINVFDTAINYRHQRSERAVGRALARAFDEGIAARDEVFVSTKGGFLPFDGDLPDDPPEYLRATYLDTGLLQPGDIAAGCHAMAPAFLEDQLERSRANLGLETVDLYYLHNPETQLGELRPAVVGQRLTQAFDFLERAAEAGTIAAWGLATWNGLRSAPESVEHLDLQAVVDRARRVRPEPRLAAVQLPLNLAMPEGLLRASQRLGEMVVPVLIAARHFGLTVFTSASILQGRLGRALPSEIGEALPGFDSDTQRALQFARSAPGVGTALVGMSKADHVRENAAVAERPPAGAEAYRRLFGPG
ncbi:MAG: aldo/keto reductase [Thermoanaerobaculia bacterium]|nr:aldo/keto reductase [Thermoanaerobaculia bacterium]